MSGTGEPIDYFGGTGSPLVRLKARISLRARRRMYALFAEQFRPGPEDDVLDVGVTPDRTLPDSNAFEQFYPYTDRVTATSIEDASALEQRFPGLTFVRTKGTSLPFADGSFTLAYCSAVLEHVGATAAQRALASEILRVADGFFIAVPNRWFPLELHTFMPFLHWLPRERHRAILRRLGRPFWAKEENLNLLGVRDLVALFPPSVDVRIHRHRILGLTSNLVAYGRSDRRPRPEGSAP